MNVETLRLCLITQIGSTPLDRYEKFILSAIKGGVTLLQLREKEKTLKELEHLGRWLKTLLKPFNIPLIINDHVDLAKKINADGVHLGAFDLPPIFARTILGKNKIIGLSIESSEELEYANKLDCINYVAASAIFESKSKSDCRTYWGLPGLKKIAELSPHPVVAIGGIDLNNVESVMEQGASGIAVISAIHDHSDPERISATFKNKIDQTLRKTDVSYHE